MQAYGQVKESNARRKAANADAEMSEFNAGVMEANARAVEQKMKFDQIVAQKKGQQAMGRLRAKLGASGAVMDEGAPLNLVVEQAFQTELQDALIGLQGQTEAAEYRSEAQAARMGAAVSRTRATNATTAGWINTGTSLLSGIGSMYSSGMFAGGGGGGGSAYSSGGNWMSSDFMGG